MVPDMSLHIHRFIDLIKSVESRNQKELHMSLRDAKDLHGDITKLLITLEQMRAHRVQDTTPVDMQISGGSFKND
jgi:hypothetical protein